MLFEPTTWKHMKNHPTNPTTLTKSNKKETVQNCQQVSSWLSYNN